MTLGRPSLAVLSLLFFSVGCASGEVTGTGTPSRGFDDRDPTAPSDNGAAAGSGETSQPTDEGPTDYEALFDAPADPSTTDDLVTGLWAGTTYYGEVRLKITGDKIVVALKCGSSPAEGIEVGSVVTPNKIRILASKSIGAGYCALKVTPMELPRCSSDVYYDCFQVSGTALSFAGKPLFTGGGGSSSDKYTKLSD